MRFIVFLFMFFITANAFAQSFNQYKTSITKYLLEENHYAAILDLEKALEYKKEEDSLRYLLGISCYKLNAYHKSETYLKSLLRTEFETRHNDVNYFLGNCLNAQGRYKEALIYFNSFMASSDDTDPFKQEATLRIEQCKWALANAGKKDPLIKMKKVEGLLNTSGNEFAPRMHQGNLYVTSQNFPEYDKKAKPTKTIGKIIKYNANTWLEEPLDDGILEENMHMAHACFSPDGEFMAFTLCNYLEQKTDLICAIYMKTKMDGKWSRKVKLPAPVNITNSTSTQPYLTTDPSSGLLKLYFSSDRLGGKGGFDLYSVLVNEDLSVTPETNLDEINTALNEYSPAFNIYENSLYFSSDGHPGYGGQDIFRYGYSGKDSLSVRNLGVSINTSYDDLYYTKGEQNRTAYLVSNRPGAAYLDQNFQACCFDVYKINIIPATLNLSVRTFDLYDTAELQNVRIQLWDITEGDSLKAESEMPKAAIHPFKITEDRKYRIIASKNNFIGDTTELSTQNLKRLDDIEKKMYLRERKILNALSFEKTTNVNLKGVKVQLLELHSNQLIMETINKDSNDFHFGLLKGKDYKLVATKNKYESAEVIITARETAEEKELNRNLYLELAAIAELRKLLPIKMFFDNDFPDPRSEYDTTRFGFLEIYNDYVGRKGRYMYEFADKLKGNAKNKAILEIDTFFEFHVKTGAEKLKIFMDKLHIILEEGHSIDIFLKGYASPRAKTDYNQHLSARRVSSIRNEFDRYRAGIFHDYIVDEHFKIKEIPFGESQVGFGVSDDLIDVRNSIYSLKAAYERRVEILEILKGVDDK